MNKLRGAMIGAGFFSQFHAEAWQRLNSAEVTAVVDAAPGRAAALAARFGIPRVYESVEEMLAREQPQFVDIVTRPESHLALVQTAAERGVHIVCQKPMAPSWDECVRMCETCERARPVPRSGK